MRMIPLILACLMLAGCAVGRRETDGAIVLGFEAGKLVETPGQALNVAADFLPEPFRSVAVGVLGIGGTALATRRSQRARDAAWDEADRKARADAEAQQRQLLLALAPAAGGAAAVAHSSTRLGPPPEPR